MIELIFLKCAHPHPHKRTMKIPLSLYNCLDHKDDPTRPASSRKLGGAGSGAEILTDSLNEEALTILLIRVN